MDLKHYSFKNQMAGELPPEGRFEEESLNKLMALDDDEYEYRLVGVNIHRGVASSGHYWSMVHTKRGEAEPDPKASPGEWTKGIESDWIKCDDDHVSTYSPSNLPADAFGGSDSSQMSAAERDIYQI